MLQKFIFCLILVAFAHCAKSQSFFKPIPKVKATPVRASALRGIAATLAEPDVTFWAVRPIASAVTIFVDGTVEAAAGGGISYQNITQRASDGRNNVNYSISALVLAGGSVIPDKPGDITKFGLMVAALNNTIGFGYAISNRKDIVTNEKKWKGGLMVSWSFNFNN